MLKDYMEDELCAARYLVEIFGNFAKRRTQIPTFCKHKTIDVLEIEELTLMTRYWQL
jgi:hypothetical protein